MKYSGHFQIDRCGSDENAVVLAADWCHRMQFFLDLWRQEGERSDYIFSAADIGSYRVTYDMIALVEKAAPESTLAADIARERSVRPSTPL